MNIVKNYLTKNDCYNSGRRIKPIGMQLHTIGTAQNTSSSLASYWNQSGVSACVHYCIDAQIEGKVLQFLPDNFRSWGDGGFGNGNLLTVELMESDYMKYTGGANYSITDEAKFKADVTRAYNTAVDFFAYKCKEYGWNPTAKLPNGLYTISSHDEGRRLGLSTAHVDPTHIWDRMGWSMDKFRSDVKKKMGLDISVTLEKMYRVGIDWSNGKCVNQLGAYTVKENAISSCPFGFKVFDDSGKAIYTPESIGTQASEFSGLAEVQVAAKILELARAEYVKTGIVASVIAAQMILESGYVRTELAKKANNCFGMKCTLSGNKWGNSTWDGKSNVSIRTAEEYTPGVITYIYADFRKYSCIEDSIADHSAYLLGAMNGSKKRYEGLQGETDYRKAITIIGNGGYATDKKYVQKICSIIERFGLDKYDHTETDFEKPTTTVIPDKNVDNFYRVGTAWKNGKCINQIGAYTVLKNAKKYALKAKENNKRTYYVFNGNGKKIYTAKYKLAVNYIVQAGCFTIKDNAENLVDIIKSNEIDAVIIKENGSYIVQCGVFSVKSNATSIIQKLKSLEIDATIKTNK